MFNFQGILFSRNKFVMNLFHVLVRPCHRGFFWFPVCLPIFTFNDLILFSRDSLTYFGSIYAIFVDKAIFRIHPISNTLRHIMSIGKQYARIASKPSAMLYIKKKKHFKKDVWRLPITLYVFSIWCTYSL